MLVRTAIAGWLVAGAVTQYAPFVPAETGAILSPRFYRATPATPRPLRKRQAQCLEGSHACRWLRELNAQSRSSLLTAPFGYRRRARRDWKYGLLPERFIVCAVRLFLPCCRDVVYLVSRSSLRPQSTGTAKEWVSVENTPLPLLFQKLTNGAAVSSMRQPRPR
jgi:hypothetical protein